MTDRITAALAVALVCALALVGVGSASASTLAAPIVGGAQDPASAAAYWEVGADGGVFAFGGAGFYGSMGGKKLNAAIVGIAPTPDGKGYWLAGADGGVFAFGDAGFYGSLSGTTLNKPIVGIVATPDGKGYWLVGADGGVFAFGDAGFYGSLGGTTLNKPIVGMARTPDGKGYLLVGADGGVFAFGDAHFYGSLANTKLNAGIVGIDPTPSGNGYWLVGADGGVFTFGGAGFYGSAGSTTLAAPVRAIDSTPSGKGYRLFAADGGVFDYGDAVFSGSLPSTGVTPAPAPAPAPASSPTVCSSAPGAGDAVTRWAPVIACVLGMHGLPANTDNIGDVEIIISHESGGNPDAINLWDSNAAAGHPSEGLMQTIMPTFQEWRSPALADNILDPAANIYAGIGYAVGRYGSLDNVPGVRLVKEGLGYVGYSDLVAATGAAKTTACRAFSIQRETVSITVSRVTCKRGHRVARQFEGRRFQHTRLARQLRHVKKGHVSRPFRLSGGFRCQYRPDPAHGTKDHEVVCTRGKKTVAWAAAPRKAHKAHTKAHKQR